MDNKLFKKGLVTVIIILFLVVSIIPSTSSYIKKQANYLNPIDNIDKNNNNILDNNLVGYWSFNDQANPGYDNSEHNNQGTVFGVTWITEGVYDGALDFDGLDDYIQFSSPVLNVPPYSVCAWVKPFSLSHDYYDSHYIISNGGETRHSHGFYLGIFYYQEPSVFEFGAATQGSNLLQVSNYPASINKWYFLVGTWDGTSNSDSVKLYVNSVLIGTYESGAWYTGSAGYLRMGAACKQHNYFFDGILDEVRIYNRTLSNNEILELYINPSGLKSALLFGRVDNLNTEAGKFITFNALKVRSIRFFPFKIIQYNSGEKIRISEKYIGFIFPKFIIGFFKANI